MGNLISNLIEMNVKRKDGILLRVQQQLNTPGEGNSINDGYLCFISGQF